MISSNTTAFGQDSSFTALLQRIWHFGSKMFSFGKLCLDFEKCFINLARTFLSSHYKNGHYSDLLQPKRMLQCSKKRLIIFWKKKNQSFIFVSGGLFQLSYFTKLPDYYKCSFTGADMRLYSKKSCETDLPSLYSMKIWVNFFPNISLSNHMH